MSAEENVRDEIEAQKRLVSRLREEIFGEDKSGVSPYIIEFLEEFRRFSATCRVEEVVESALESDVIYFGDYHPLEPSQRWAAGLMKEFTSRGMPLVLAMEMLYEYQQESLDRWMKGRYSEEEFLGTIDYDSEWGFDWESYRPFFTAAKDPLVPIFGIDSRPRDQLRYIRQRDEMMGRRIASIRSFFPSSRVLVVVGESHLASGHLPLEVDRACREAGAPVARSTVIVQNMDDIYWELLEKGIEDSSAVRVGKGRYCVFTASPILKYQSYRDIIDVWTDHSISMPALDSLVEMVENILAVLGRGDGDEAFPGMEEGASISEIFPEIVRKKTYDAIAAFLRSRGVGEEGILSAVENLRDSGMEYFPALNLFLMVRFDRACAAREAARFVVRTMRGDSGVEKRERSDADRFYAYVFEEALAWAGGTMVDPPLRPVGRTDLLSTMDGRGVVVRPVEGLSMERTRELAGMLRYHRKRERTASSTMRVTAGLERIFKLDIRERQLVIRALARPLGRAIYDLWHSGGISREELGGLFSEDFTEAGSGPRLYLEWLRRTRG